MTDRFDLEQQILECWRVTTDVEEVCEAVMERDLSTDDISNALIGIKALYDIKFEKLWATFETMIRQGQFTGMNRNVQFEKEKLVAEIRGLDSTGLRGQDYIAGYEHGRDDAATVVETS